MISRSPPSFSINSCRLPEAKPRGGRLGLRSPEFARTARIQREAARCGQACPEGHIQTFAYSQHDRGHTTTRGTSAVRYSLLAICSHSLIHLSLRHHSTTPCLCAHPAKRAHQHSLTPPSTAALGIIHPPCSPTMLQSVCSDAIQEHFTRHSIVTPIDRRASRQASRHSVTTRQAGLTACHTQQSHNTGLTPCHTVAPRASHDNVAQ